MEINNQSHIVTCIDILGYKEILHRDNQEEIDKIETEFFYFVEENAPRESNFPGFDYITYTDNFLFYYKLNYDSNGRKKHDAIRELYGESIKGFNERIERVLYLHIFSLALTQFDLCVNNYFIRGGLTIGGFKANGKIISGSGLLESHSLEEKAVYPRIIINPIVVKDFISFSRPIPLLIDLKDEIIFIDFLDAAMRERLHIIFGNDIQKDKMDARKYEIFKSEFVDVRSNIINALQNNSDDRVLNKYRWLAKYFDFFCYSHDSLGLDKLAIESQRDKYEFENIKNCLSHT